MAGNPYLTDFKDNRGEDMTLRDLFAAFIVAGMYAGRMVDGGEKMTTLAANAYRCADAMLEARTP